MAKQRLISAAERVAPALRRVGLGGLIDRTAARFSGQLGSAIIEFEGLSIATGEIGHLYYLRDLVDDGHDRYFRELFTAAIPSGGTAVEAGAHIGVMTLFAARAAGPNGRVVTFEPNAATLSVLRRNIEANGFADRVEVVPLGLSDERATRTFYVSGGGETSSLHDPGTASHTITVTTVPGDEHFATGARIDAVKLDIEGNEVGAIRGMQRTLREAGPILTVFAECNQDMLSRAGHSAADLVAALEACDLEVRWIDDEEERIRDLDDGLPGDRYVNLIATRPGLHKST
jgi:FkbM family methyltransferase